MNQVSLPNRSVTPPPPLPDGPSVLGDFEGHPSNQEVASPKITITVLSLSLVLFTKQQCVWHPRETK